MGTPSSKDARPHETIRSERESGLLSRLRAELARDLEVIRHLGEESFGSLFLAREVALRRLVVVKVLTEEFARAWDARRRFERAGLAAAGITHPNVVPIFRVGNLDDGTPFYVEPYLGECTLAERLSALGRLEPGQVRRILRDLAGGLAAAHQQGIVHRGIHPGAVRCEDGSERVLLTDFGLSGLLDSVRAEGDRLTPSGEILGSVGYMSPEQMSGHPATDRSDVFSLGLLGWRLLVGPGPSYFGVAGRETDQWEAWAGSVGDDGLVDLLGRCLSQDPHARPSAEDIVRELRPGSPEAEDGGEQLWAGLTRRRIPHAFLIYCPASWAILQVVDQLVQQGLLPRRAYLLALATVVAGLPVALTLAWYHGARGRQRVTAKEVWVLGAILVAWMVALVVTWLSVGGV